MRLEKIELGAVKSTTPPSHPTPRPNLEWAPWLSPCNQSPDFANSRDWVFYKYKTPVIQIAGVMEIDQIITVLLTTSMAVGGIIGCFLDNLLPGTLEERGMLAWKSSEMGCEDESVSTASNVYDLPWCLKRLSRLRVAKYLPFIVYDSNSEKGDQKMI